MANSTNNAVRKPILILAAAESCIVCMSVMGVELLSLPDFALWREAASSSLIKAVVVSAVLITSLVSMGLYQIHQRHYFKEIAVRIAVAIAFAGFVLAAVYYAVPELALSRTNAFNSLMFAFVAILGLRLYFFRHIDASVFRRRTLIFGDKSGENALSGLRRSSDRRGFVLVATIDANRTNLRLFQLAKEHDADEIVVAFGDRRGRLPVAELLECVFNGITVVELPEFLERESGKIRTDLINPSSLIFDYGFQSSKIQRAAKRALDLILSMIVFVPAFPFMLIVAILIIVEDGPRSSLLYRQTRVGYKGAHFSILKFRSMVENAEKETGAVWAQENDSRVTRVGRVIRKLRLDELPQLFNVLRGDMSLVGPRPERPEFVEKLTEEIPFYMERHMVKPGITGWAQLRYPYGSTSIDALNKLQFDIFYIKNQSVTLDIVLMLQTVEVVLFGKGAR